MVSIGSGAFGKKEHAQEEQFFRKKEQEEIEELKEELKQKPKTNKNGQSEKVSQRKVYFIY